MFILTMITCFGFIILLKILTANSMDSGNEAPIVQAVVGYTATIPCNLSTPLADDEASLILWYRMDTPNPIYTLDVRNTDLQSARHFPAGNARGRTFFDVTVHPPVLVLDGVEIEDEGDYKCRVDLKRSRTLILHSKLDVIVPPGEPIIMDEHGQRLRGIIGPYDEGSTLTLSCEVDGGDPSPNVTWWRDSALIDSDFNSTQGFVRNTMIVRHIRRSDLMTEFVCKASNNDLGKPREATVRLDINLLPLEVKIMNLHFPVLAGLLQEVKCEAVGSRPRAYLTWWLDDEKIEVGTYEKFQRGGNYTLSTLQFTPKPEDHGRKLVCKAVNTVFPETAVKSEETLQVQSIPIVSMEFADHSNHSFVEEDTNVQIECLIRADPPIIDVTWHHNDRPLREDRMKGVLIRNRTIEIEKAKKEHRGKYRCFATNAIGRGSSNYVQLDILFAPACRAPASLTYGIGNSEPAKLSCDVEATPDVVLYRWVLNNSLGTVVLRDWNDESFDSALTYTPEEDSDFGTLLCWGQNSVGTQKEPCIFNIVPAGAPDAPYDCRVLNETAYSIAVDCKPGYDRGLKQTFHMELYDSVEENIVTNVTNPIKPSFKTVGLVPGMSYVVVVYASNVKGRSNSLLLVASTLTSQGFKDAQAYFLSNHPLIIVLVGAVIILVIALAVAIYVIRTRMSQDEDSKDSSYMVSKTECERDKKETEEAHDASEKGPDIIPHSKDSEVFYMDSILEDIHCAECLTKEDSPPTELIRQKYMATVL